METTSTAHTVKSNSGTAWTVVKVNGNFAIFEDGEYRTFRSSLKSARTWANVAANHGR